MIRKFECENCGHHFEADDRQQVACPKCKSDNIDVAGSGGAWKILLWVFLLAIVVAVVLWRVLTLASSIENKDPDEESKNPDTADVVIDIKMPATVEVSELTFEKGGYAFEAKGQNIPVKEFYYVVLDSYDHKKEVARSKDGRFKDVPFCEEDSHTYDIAVVDAQTDTIVCLIDKPGFVRQVAVATCQTADWLQKLIDAHDLSLIGAGENDYVSPECELVFQGLSADATNVPTNLFEVLEKLEMDTWQSVKVTAVDCDKMNRIVKIRLSVFEADNDF